MSRTCSIDAAVDHLLQTIEGPIRMGLPLGLGKPNRLVNALYQRLRTLPERQLTLRWPNWWRGIPSGRAS